MDVNRSAVRLPGPSDSSIEDKQDEPDEHAALRLVWLVFAGWWLSALWVAIAWFSILLVVTRPAGFRMIAYLPIIVRLKPADDIQRAIVEDTLAQLAYGRLKQRPFVVRLLYCGTVGWWVSLVWAIVAWAASLSSHRQPEPMMMFMRLPAVMTLRRY
jgi:hypothetical protein